MILTGCKKKLQKGRKIRKLMSDYNWSWIRVMTKWKIFNHKLVHLKRSRQERLADSTPGFYQSSLIKVQIFKFANIIRPMIKIQSTQKSHINMVTLLANLNAGSDDFGPDEPLTLKKANASHYWKKFEKTMYIEFQYVIRIIHENTEKSPLVQSY